MEQIASTIIKFSFVPNLLVALYALFIFKKLPVELKTFVWYILLSATIELVSRLFWLNSKNNMPLLHLYVAGGFFCLALFYQEVLNGFINKNIIRGSIVTFLLFTIVNSLFIQNIYTFNSYALTVESILVVTFSLSTYMLMLNDIVKSKRLSIIRSLNWINSGLFIYYASSLLIFYFGDIFNRSFPRNFILQTWVLHSFFSVIMYCCFFVGLWNRPRN